MTRRIPHIGIPTLLTVMNVQTMNYNVGHVLDGNARSSSNVDAGSSTVDGLEGVHDQLLLQLYHHVTFEDDPEWLILYYTVSECTWLGTHRVIPCIRYHIYFPISATNGMLPKPNRTVS